MREFVTACMWSFKLVCPRILAACHFSLAVKGCGINHSLCAQIMKCRCVTEHLLLCYYLIEIIQFCCCCFVSCLCEN